MLAVWLVGWTRAPQIKSWCYRQTLRQESSSRPQKTSPLLDARFVNDQSVVAVLLQFLLDTGNSCVIADCCFKAFDKLSSVDRSCILL